MKQWWRNVRPGLLATPIYCLARLIGLTLRIKLVGFQKAQSAPGGKIYAGWHGRTFIAANVFKGLGVWTIISMSRDGEMQNKIFRKFGFKTIRGSTGRGGVKAAIEAIKVLREGATMAFTPDGPRGPSGVVQDGIMMMAHKSGASLFPVGVSARRRWLIRSWDRYLIPMPFSRCIMIWGEPLTLSKDATPEQVEECRLKFQAEMHRLEAEAEREMGHVLP